jgi:hypothetical protein
LKVPLIAVYPAGKPLLMRAQYPVPDATVRDQFPLASVVTLAPQVSIATPDKPAPELLVTRPEIVTLLAAQLASATHRLVEPHPTGLQVVVCWRWVAKQPPAPQEPLVQVPQVQAVQLASATHRLVEPHPTGLQVVVCWRWVAEQPPAAQEPLVHELQLQVTGQENDTGLPASGNQSVDTFLLTTINE